MELRNAVIVGGNRTPFTKAGGKFANASAQDLLTSAIDGLVARYGLAGQTVNEVAAGAVLKHSRDFNLTREAVLGSALSAHTPACDLAQACGTGLETVIYISNKIRLGQATVGIAGGADSASDAPVVVSEPMRDAMLKASRAKTLPEKLKAIAKLRPAHLAPVPPAVVEPRTGLSMGESQALTTAKWDVPREAQDEMALASHQNLAKAWDEGFFDDLVTPYLGVAKDTILRPDTTAEKLARLKPVFGRGENATMTAGNSTALSDGAAVVLLAEEGHAREQGWPVLARLVDAQVAAADYVTGKEDLLLAPTRAIPELLERNSLTMDDFDYIEIHEAFAATVLATLKALEEKGITVDRSKLNVHGSSLAAGHPFAATGARIVASLAKLLSQKGPGSRGFISICAAGGQGVTAILEA